MRISHFTSDDPGLWCWATQTHLDSDGLCRIAVLRSSRRSRQIVNQAQCKVVAATFAHHCPSCLHCRFFLCGLCTIGEVIVNAPDVFDNRVCEDVRNVASHGSDLLLIRPRLCRVVTIHMDQELQSQVMKIMSPFWAFRPMVFKRL